MKRFLNYRLLLPFDWVIFFVYTFFMDTIAFLFHGYDFMMHSGYRYGPGSFSITVFFIIMLFGFMYLFLCSKYSAKPPRGVSIIIVVLLIVLFIIQAYIFLDYYSMYFLFGYALNKRERICILFFSLAICTIPFFVDHINKKQSSTNA